MDTTTKNTHSAFHDDLDDLVGCPLCDALNKKPSLDANQQAHCWRCGEKLYSKKADAIDRSIALALTCLILFLPAINLPIMGVYAVGIYHEASVIECIELVLKTEYYLVAICVFLFAITVPAVRFFSILYVCLRIKYNKVTPHLLHFFNSFYLLNSWAMLHVFILGIVVSIYKLVDLAELHVGMGMLCYALLLFCSAIGTSILDRHTIWDILERKLKEQGYAL